MATKTLELANLNSCINQAELDEPVFVIRANDVNAGKTVRAWASFYFDEKDGIEKMSNLQRAKYYEAQAAADAMDAWRESAYERAMGTSPARSWRHRRECVDTSCPGCRNTL